MTSTTFDTLAYSKKLQELGFTREQSEGFAQLQRELIDDKLATKQDLREMEVRLMAEIAKSRAETLKWTAGMLMAQAAIVATLVKLL